MFVYRQNTAYELRIKICSSDVCSTDLDAARDLFRRAHPPARLLAQLRLVKFFHRALDHVPIAALELDGTGRDDVHANAVLAMEKRKLLSPGHERSLHRIIGLRADRKRVV